MSNLKSPQGEDVWDSSLGGERVSHLYYLLPCANDFCRPIMSVCMAVGDSRKAVEVWSSSRIWFFFFLWSICEAAAVLDRSLELQSAFSVAQTQQIGPKLIPCLRMQQMLRKLNQYRIRTTRAVCQKVRSRMQKSRLVPSSRWPEPSTRNACLQASQTPVKVSNNAL